ncbi:hypothetical protein BZG19_11495 [Salinivibrio kushneri]|nr:hypothetical protein BZG19_11495 [Salinivibrio kushneri]
MLAVPLPYIATLILIMTAIVIALRRDRNWHKPFTFTVFCAAMTFIVGLRWAFDLATLRFIQTILAAFLPIAAWYGFAEQPLRIRRFIWHLCGPAIVIACSFSPYLIGFGVLDVLLATLSVGYGVCLLIHSLRLPQAVSFNRFSLFLLSERAAGSLLLFSALIDVLIAWDFSLASGEHARAIVSVSYLLFIPALVATMIIASYQLPASKEQESKKSKVTENDAESDVVERFKALMDAEALFTDPDLSLIRLARKLGVPSRSLSSAINAHYGQNISRVINEYRIEYAKKRLLSSDDTIMDILLSAGFYTKSNFNREFSRVAGQTPSAYRKGSVNEKQPIITG